MKHRCNADETESEPESERGRAGTSRCVFPRSLRSTRHVLLGDEAP